MAEVKTLEKQIAGYSQTPDSEIFSFEKNYGAQHYGRLEVCIRQAIGCWLTRLDGSRYLDCLSAYSAANPGHAHPKIVAAMVDALQNNHASVISNVVYTDSLGIFLKRVAELVPQLGVKKWGNNGNKVLPKNGGVESVETAVKAARYYGWKEKGIEDSKQEIIVFERNFHGRTTTVVSFSPSKDYNQGFGPLTPGFVIVPFGDAEATAKAVNKNTCGILVEPMQGEGGMYPSPPGFLAGLRQIADDNDIMLIFDEIQSGLGRTGKMFAFEHDNVVPDAVVLGKAISGGLVPLSVFVCNSQLMDIIFQPGRDGSTYGGYPLACVAGNAALDVIVNEELPERSAKMGNKLRTQIEFITNRSSHVKEVRGSGLFIGIEVKNGDAMVYCRELLKLGVLANDSHGHTIRISPPLIITDDEIDYLCERLEKVLID